jgi:hypothetical protein
MKMLWGRGGTSPRILGLGDWSPRTYPGGNATGNHGTRCVGPHGPSARCRERNFQTPIPRPSSLISYSRYIDRGTPALVQTLQWEVSLITVGSAQIWIEHRTQTPTSHIRNTPTLNLTMRFEVLMAVNIKVTIFSGVSASKFC